MTKTWVGAAALVVATLGLGACGQGGDELKVERAWARPSATMSGAGAVYFEVVNDSKTADRLTAVVVARSVAARAELHRSMTDTSGMSMMHPVDGVDVPAGKAVVFEPGGLHVMLVDLAGPLERDSTFELTLEFEHAGRTKVEVAVREEARQ